MQLKILRLTHIYKRHVSTILSFGNLHKLRLSSIFVKILLEK